MAWAFLTRAGGEIDVLEELGASSQGRATGEGVVLAERRPRQHDGSHEALAFARQAMRVTGTSSANDPNALAGKLAGLLPRRPDPSPYILQVVAPDSRDPHDPRRRTARALEEALPGLLDALLPPALQTARRSSEVGAEWLLQVWVIGPEQVLYGLTPAGAALSVFAGGKMHLKRPDDALSRSGLKLEEAIHWIGLGPEKGDLCVDLGAAPGGWSQVALNLGAVVAAVDPAVVKLPELKNKFTHLKQSAFDFVPPEPVDWLLCDMAWRPLEVAKLICKWGHRGWARQLIVNFKLPMKQKVKIVAEILEMLKGSGWDGLRARQLYHDRDEITIFGWVNAGIVARGPLPAFELRAARKHKRPDEKRKRSNPARDDRRVDRRRAARGGEADWRTDDRRGGSRLPKQRPLAEKQKAEGRPARGDTARAGRAWPKQEERPRGRGGPRSGGKGPRSSAPRSGGPRSGGPRSGGPRRGRR